MNVNPEFILNQDQAYSNDSLANLQMVGFYSKISYSSEFTYQFSLDLGLISDELMPIGSASSSGTDSYNLYNYKITASNSPTNTYWGDLYNYIYLANTIIEGATKSTKIGQSTKNQLIGEALTWRSYCYYYLLNFYGDIPYITNGDYKQNQQKPRISKDSIIVYCINDLKKADSFVSQEYPTQGKFRVNKSFVDGILSRFYLQKGDYNQAIISSSNIINSGLYSLEDLNNLYNADSKETILQFWNQNGYTDIGQQTQSSSTTYGVTNGTAGSLYDSYLDSDLRKSRFIKSITDDNGNKIYIVNKYQNNGIDQNTTIVEYPIILKLDEIYLNRAEAYAKFGMKEKALSDINVIRKRAGLDMIDRVDNLDELLNLIYSERRKELAFDCADRWITLKRNNTINTTLEQFKPNVWINHAALFPIPLDDIQKTHLIQNPGY